MEGAVLTAETRVMRLGMGGLTGCQSATRGGPQVRLSSKKNT